MTRLMLAALILSIGCGQMGGPVEYVCQPANECIDSRGACFTCNAGYVCGDGGQWEVTCVAKDVFGGGPWVTVGTGCPDSKTYQYSGYQYTACYNTYRQAKVNGCSNIESNCR
jgi:hypothetical protein